MEHKAHYAIVGFFAIALAIAAGLFVVWLGRIDFDQEWSRYDVVFDGPVRGLTETSEVRFNGIKVGEVTRLYLDPEDPSRVIARIRVLEEAPLKSDSLAQLEPQGLTGLSYIQVTAGSPGAPELEADGAEVPRITSRPAQLDSIIEGGEDVVSEAIEALRAINSVMSPENQETLATILENLEGFSEAVSGTEDTVARLETTLAEIGEAASALEEASTAFASFAETGERFVLNELTTSAREVELASIEVNKASIETGEMVQAIAPSVERFATSGLPELENTITETQLLVRSLERLVSELERDPQGFVANSRIKEVELAE